MITTNNILYQSRFNVLCCSVLLSVVYLSATAAESPEEPRSFNIWPGEAPGTEDWPKPEFVGKNSVTNVTVPTLTVYAPETGKSNGTAVIVLPGGGFQGLAMAVESNPASEWLAERGVTAFNLKYRVRYTPGLELPAGEDFDSRQHFLDEQRKIAVADGIQAMRYLRENADKFGIDSSRIGMVGFSAGAMTAMGVILEGEREVRPNFAAVLYGSMPELTPPKDGPPLFIAHAQDDPAVPVAKSVEIYQSWTAAGLPVELHVFEQGGHGFGAKPGNRAADRWLDFFAAWLQLHGWIGAAEE